MSRRDDTVSLGDMLSHSKEAVELLGGISKDIFVGDRLKQLALTRLVEIVGESANRVTSGTQNRHPEIPWRQIIDTRNRLIHGYDLIDLDILWNTLTVDLPELILLLENLND